MEKQIMIKRDGLMLHGLIDIPNQDEFDLVILMHGFTSDLGYAKGQLLYDLTPALQQKGLGTLRFDFNGHGKSEGRLSEMTILNELADANAVLNFARQLKGIQHIYLLGHSQGGVIASLMAAYYPDAISKLVLMSPAATLVDDARLGICQGSIYNPHHIPDTITVNQKTIGGFYFRTAQLLPLYDIAKHFDGPVCLIHGTDDTIVNPSASLRYNDVYKNSILNLIPNCDHSYLNLEKRKQAISIACDFLTR
ncbi:alpha/beta hydrolase [Limosilactobacillus allomucosae]|uniref:alpha/beta hydrolase n=1 Tax=Limosilactobacillus allomucosae TaxID=3142938 RepID=UPI003266A253